LKVRKQQTDSVLQKGTEASSPKCPQCKSFRTWKSGLRSNKSQDIQRYVCRDCDYRFSNPLRVADCKEAEGSLVPIQENSHRVCASRRAKNLIVANDTGATGDKTNRKQITMNYAWWMKKQGYAEQTIEGRISIVNTLLTNQVELDDPESVKEYIASQDCTAGRKRNIVHAISTYYKSKGINWDPPRFQRIQKIPWIPQESLIDQLIAGCPGKFPAFLQILKETGMRPGEAWNLVWNDLDFGTKQVRITPEKGSNPRVLPISNTMIAMLHALPQKDERVFRNGRQKHFAQGFRRHRMKIAKSLGNPDINRISFKTLRHFKGTMEYHKTKDILHVKMVLGHKNIKNTLVYTQLINFKADEYISKIAKNAEEASGLIEAGFDYVCTTPDELMVFKKRK
jgi:integrase